MAGLGAAIGVGIDALVRGNTLIYARSPPSAKVTLSPILGRGRTGALLAIGF
jgi:hypothetical protein